MVGRPSRPQANLQSLAQQPLCGHALALQRYHNAKEG